MRIIFTCTACLLISLTVFSQTNTKAVKPDEDIKEVFTIKEIYTYPQFAVGKVFLKDGSKAESKLNYNRFFEQMLFIDAKNDTLALANPELIKYVAIGNDSFYFYKENCLQLLANYNTIKLASKKILTEVDVRKNSAYGSTVTNASVSSYRQTYTIDGQPLKMQPGESTIFSLATEYFLSDAYNNFVPATKKNIEKIFSKDKQKLKYYLQNTRIDFNKEQDLKNLVQHMLVLG